MKNAFIVILLLIGMPRAQTYSRWTYTSDVPYNPTADAAIVEFYKAQLNNHGKGAIRIHTTYKYTTATDSSFEVPDVGLHLIRMFDPSPAPDDVAELERENEVYVLTKQSPLKVQKSVGGDGILPPHQAVKAINRAILEAARVEAKILRSKVNTKCTADKKLKRKDAWTAAKAERKAEKAAKGKSINK